MSWDDEHVPGQEHEELVRAAAALARGPAGEASGAILDGVRERGYSIALEGDARRGLGVALDHLADAPVDAAARAEIDALVGSLADHEYQVATLDPQRRYEVSMIAAPVFDTNGHAALALTLLGFDQPLEPSRVSQLGERVRDAGIVVTKQTKGRLPG